MALLEVSDIRTRYGAIEALKGVSLTVEPKEVVTLIGANGAGKSTTLQVDLGTDAGHRRKDHLRGRGHNPSPCARGREPRYRTRSRGPALLSSDDRAREP